jgi:alanyl-tRNA synthetase
MNNLKPMGSEIRKSFIDFFIEKAGHHFVRSSSLVPGDDSTLLFTNAGMVQFKDVFLGIEKPQFTRAVNSQKILRVAGKHNDLEEVGQDNTHHTFFEMLGNWSFGDYYKEEAIAWAWELLTEVWGIPKNRLYATVFKDELGEIPTDEEAASNWRQQPGFSPGHLFYLGRKDNFWEMAETGPCGPCSEIHIDLDPDAGEVTPETLETDRFTELWNLVFIQYNRTSDNHLKPLPAVHVDTGMGFERIVDILQGTESNYRTDLFWPLIQKTAQLTGHSDEDINHHFTPYRVIADHARAATFLIADGVVPGNMGRNYICRMIIRRAYRFGGKIGLNKPFLADIAETVINNYGDVYPELVRNRSTILDTITREEGQFKKTLDKSTTHLHNILDQVEKEGKDQVTGAQAADLHTTFGMPFEITRDIAQERGFSVDRIGFVKAMETHRLASGAGKAMGTLGGENVDFYRQIFEDLLGRGKLTSEGVKNNPYDDLPELSFEGEILTIIRDLQPIMTANPGDSIEIILPETKFYIESGGQVADHGEITGDAWKIQVSNVLVPAAGIITHIGKVVHGHPNVGDKATVSIDVPRRRDIMRNHTATHLLHAALHKVLGDHARQAGSLVAPDRLRFDFTHPESLNQEEIHKIEDFVNQKILANHNLNITYKSIEDALENGAIALFGENYGDEVRNITIGEGNIFSNELCGGTHVDNTGVIGTFIITHESSAAAGIRRIEAITGREAYDLIQKRFRILENTALTLSTSSDQLVEKSSFLNSDNKNLRNQIAQLRQEISTAKFSSLLNDTHKVGKVNVLTAEFTDSDVNTLRQMADRFRQHFPQNGVVVLTSVIKGRPIVITAITPDLVQSGIHAGKLADFVARQLGGGGGGKPTLAQAGGKDPSKLIEALNSVPGWIEENIV